MSRNNSASAKATHETESETAQNGLKVLETQHEMHAVVDETGADDAPETPDEQTEGEQGDPEPIAPPRANGELLPNVQSAAQTITNCSDNEVKNYCATTDFVCRQLAVQLADKWKSICRTAEKNGKEGEKPAKVCLAFKIDVDHSNILLMDTKANLSFSAKESVSAETQEDLRQVEFQLN